MNYDTTTKAGRHALYKRMLENAMGYLDTDCPPSGFCSLLSYITWGRVDMYHLPELMRQKPSRVSRLARALIHGAPFPGFWWKIGDWKPRIKALKRAIELSKP